VLIALLMLWVPAVMHIDRFPFILGFGALAFGAVASFVVLLLRLPREARMLVRRTLRTRRVATALAVAAGGVAVAFAAVTFVPPAELPQTLPVAIIVTIAARILATARLRSPVGRGSGGGRNQPSSPARRLLVPHVSVSPLSPG
jgi:peptidoglycan/LPS O-acetylase OafA/YrhL